jgi:RNA polymerase sigma-70 factor (ECF subfamily)
MVNNDSIIIQKVIAGNTDAFAILVDRYKDLAISLAFNVLLDKEDAEDIVQDSFIKAFGALSTFKGDAKFATWFYRIVLNTALNKRKAKRLATIDMEALTPEDENDGILPDLAHCTAQQQRKYIQQALKHLSEGERICITLYYLHELSLHEIQELTTYSTANIKVLLFRGRKQLYNALQRILKTEIEDLI